MVSISGWGGYLNYESSNFHTSLALQALKAANYTDATIINPALAYLTTSQNTDGGWGFYQGDASNVYMTAIVSATLQQFPQMTTIATAVSKATSFLLSRQNTDGGFGNSPSTVYDTALAYVALIGMEQTRAQQAAPLQNAVNYLMATQSANGSWNDDPYSTALAIKALHYSENIPPSPPPPPPAGKITGTAIDAATGERLSGVTAVLESNSLIYATTDATGTFTLPDVPPGSQKVNLSLSGYASKSAETTVTENATASLGTVSLVSKASTGTIAGTVTDPAGKPLAGATVAVTGVWSGSTVTGFDGSFSLTYVTPGQVLITTTAVGYQPVTGTGTVYARTTLTFSPRLSTTPPTTGTGTIVGRVVDDYWGLPIGHLPEEKGVTVTIPGGLSVEPDDKGYFHLQGLNPNTYQVTISMSGYTSRTFRTVVIAGGTTDLGTIKLGMTVSEMGLTGMVTDAATGAPIAGAEVAITGYDLTARTDFAGGYALSGIPHPTTFTLKASAKGYTGKSFTVRSALWNQTLNIALAPQATTGKLTGTVVDAVTRQPLMGVFLSVAGAPSIRAESDLMGTFSFAAVPKGARQILLYLPGYTQRTLTTAIVAGADNNVGSIPLSVTPTGASVQGIVWDSPANAPFPGVTMEVSGTTSRQAVTAADGTYRMDDVVPGKFTVATAAIPKVGYYGTRFIGTVEPGGLVVFNPALSTTPTASVDMTLQTDKAVYQDGETVNLSFNLANKVAATYPATLNVQVSDPSGVTTYAATIDVTLPADGFINQSLSFALPQTAVRGMYTVSADLLDDGGLILTSLSQTFGVKVSQIAVTPVLPPSFATGENTVSFNLANTGMLPVASGALEVVLKDPDGQTVYTASQPFTLDVGESGSLQYTLSVPLLRFGTYTMLCLQSDETKSGQATQIQLPNIMSIAASLDKPLHRVRETATITVDLANTGRFDLNAAAGQSVQVTASVPDAGYSETKSASIDSGGAGVLMYGFAIPATMAAGQHNVVITATLPSGSSMTKLAQLAIPEASLSLAPLKPQYAAGEVIQAIITNSGGVDASVEYRLGLSDARSAQIAGITGAGTAAAGASLQLTLPVPTGAVDGPYSFAAAYGEANKAEVSSQFPLAVTGIKGSLAVRTDKQEYLATESIAGLSTATNTGGATIDGANLHLQVVAAGNTQQKTWTTQADFQLGVRNGVDTYGVNDWLILDDDFDSTPLNTDRWAPYGSVNLQTGKALIDSSSAEAGLNTKYRLTNDFDLQLDFNQNNSAADEGITLTAIWDDYFGFITNTRNSGYSSDIYKMGKRLDGRSTGSSTFSLSGSLRLVRAGNTFVSYYKDGTAWKELFRSMVAGAGPATVNIKVWRGQGLAATAIIDNFRLNSGRIVTQEETVDSVRLLPLNDNFDDGVLNRDRWSVWGKNEANESSGLFHLSSNSTYAWHGITHRGGLNGDYSAVATYRNFSTAPSPGNLGTFHMEAWSEGTGFYIMRGSGNMQQASGEFLNGAAAFQSGSYYNYSFGSPVQYLSSSGSFRLRRAGTTGFMDYWNGTNWQNIYSKSGVLTSPASILLDTFSSSNRPSVRADVDSFSTDKGTYAASGTITLRYDSSIASSKWMKVFHNVTVPLDTAIKFRTRTSNTESALAGAAWSEYFTVSGSSVTSPPGRYIEIEATLSTIDTKVTPLLHDLTVTYGNDPGDILWQSDVPVSLAQEAISDMSRTIGSLPAGKYYLQGVLSSTTMQEIAWTEYPFYVEQGNLALLLATDQKVYRTGDNVTVTGEVKNRSTVNATGLVLRVQFPGGTPVLTETFNLPAGASHTFSFTLTAGSVGKYTLNAAVTQNSAVLAEIPASFEAATTLLTATLTTPESAGDTSFPVTVTLTNSGKLDATTRVRLAEVGGEVIDEQEINIPAGETRLLQYTRRITADTTIEAVFEGDLSQTLARRIAHILLPSETSVGLRIATDKIGYNANEQMVITATVSGEKVASLLADSMAEIAVFNSAGQIVWSDSALIPLITQDQIISIRKYWHTSANPAGSYTARLQVTNGTSVLGTATATFSILGSSQTAATMGAALKGTIETMVDQVGHGTDQVLTFSVTNIGNEDLDNVSLTILVADPETGDVMQTEVRSGCIEKSGKFTGAVVVPTSPLALRVYVAVLQAALPAVSEPRTLGSVTFTVKDATPPVLTVSTLSDGSYTNNETLNIAGTVQDATGIGDLEVNDAPVAVNADGSFSHAVVLKPGANTVTVTATDVAGNSATSSRTIYLDLTAPVLVVSSPADNAKTAVGTSTVSGMVDETSTVAIEIGGAAQTAVMNGTGFSATVSLAYGYNTIEITATDMAGNRSSHKRTVIYDNEAPSLAVTSPDQDIRTNLADQIIKGTAHDALTAVSVTISHNGENYNPPTSNGNFEQAITLSEEKTYPVVVTATDEAGISTTVQRNIIYDITPPALTIDPLPSPTATLQHSVTGTREAGTTVMVTSPTATLGEVSYPSETTWRVENAVLAEGDNMVTATSVDAAGNRATGLSLVTLVTIPPEITVTTNPSVIWPPNKKMVGVTVTGEAIQGRAEIASVTVNVTDEYGKYNYVGLTLGTSIQLEAWRNGDDMDGRRYSITAIATDIVGNSSTATTTVMVPHDLGR